MGKIVNLFREFEKRNKKRKGEELEKHSVLEEEIKKMYYSAPSVNVDVFNEMLERVKEMRLPEKEKRSVISILRTIRHERVLRIAEIAMALDFPEMIQMDGINKHPSYWIARVEEYVRNLDVPVSEDARNKVIEELYRVSLLHGGLPVVETREILTKMSSLMKRKTDIREISETNEREPNTDNAVTNLFYEMRFIKWGREDNKHK